MTAAPPEESVSALAAKLERIDQLEKEIAPAGVSFAVRGQERVTDAHEVQPISDKLRAADIAIEVLEARREIIAELEGEGLL